MYDKKKLYGHLAYYKDHRLEIKRNGIWKRNGKEYPHILPCNQTDANLIDCGYFNELKDLKSSIKLHSDFHHLNSSQALAFNLMVPIQCEKMYTTLLSLIGESDDVEEFHFEYVEDEMENTNFDFFIKSRNSKYYFELKYTENRFGSAKDDQRHNQKYQTIYKSRLEKIVKIDKKEFFKRYQLWRNLIYTKNGIVVFVLPKFRKDIADEIELAKEKMFKKDSVKILFIDDLCLNLISCKNEKIATHYREFYNKYLDIQDI